MKKFYATAFRTAMLTALMFIAASYLSAQNIVVRWNFNGPAADQVPGGADNPLPEVGTGIASLIGGTTATFASGVASGGSSDPVTTSPPNYGWNTTTYPAQGANPKTAGVQFRVSTVGFDNIQFMFDQRLSNTAANTWVVQYTTNIAATPPVWVDAQTFTFEPQPTGTGDVWYNQRTVNLSGVQALANNPNVAFRIVSDFDPTSGNYLAARSTSTYGTSGTSRFDMVTVMGSPATSLIENNLRNARIWFDGTQIQVRTDSFTEGKIELYDLLGNVIGSKQIYGTSANISSYLSTGVLMIKLTDLAGRQITRKIIIR
ncbi:MAG TPA: T9SS type A sorting domain-containing protein [Bacteroidales bacterium]|nr:T9SS type A sorting domain-containing protein [Bacteroidales bacterium]